MKSPKLSNAKLLEQCLCTLSLANYDFANIVGTTHIYSECGIQSYALQNVLNSKERHLILVKAHYSIGKSIQLSEELSDLKRLDSSLALVLILSGRRSLAHGQKALFKGFELYLDRNPESLHKLSASGYNAIILDEFKTITQNFSGPTMGNKNTLCHDIYKSLLHSARLVIALDAFLDSSSTVHLQDLTLIDAEKSTVHWNRYLRDKRNARFYNT
ncbi:10525_t:CDS:2, partial [Funneliformis mosseae]